MTKSVLVAMAIVSLAPAATKGAVVVAPPSAAATDGFSLTGLLDGADHVLASVDDRGPAPFDPFGSGAVAFAASDIGAPQNLGATHSSAGYGRAEASAQEPLPEPTTWLMMILGFFGLSFAVRRRSSQTGNRVRFS